jgi:hypothetical protein
VIPRTSAWGHTVACRRARESTHQCMGVTHWHVEGRHGRGEQREIDDGPKKTPVGRVGG